MLSLKVPTKKEWLPVALGHIDKLLADHAHCEKKAAATGLSLITKYPEKEKVVDTLLPLVQEELGHFRLVYEIIQRRGYRFGKEKGDLYVNDLLAERWKQEPDLFLDSLLIAAIIEARSYERLKLLADHIQDPELKDLYSVFAASEARHYTLYLDLAKQNFPGEHVQNRLEELLELEKKIVLKLPNEPRIHG